MVNVILIVFVMNGVSVTPWYQGTGWESQLDKCIVIAEKITATGQAVAACYTSIPYEEESK